MYTICTKPEMSPEAEEIANELRNLLADRASIRELLPCAERLCTAREAAGDPRYEIGVLTSNAVFWDWVKISNQFETDVWQAKIEGEDNRKILLQCIKLMMWRAGTMRPHIPAIDYLTMAYPIADQALVELKRTIGL